MLSRVAENVYWMCRYVERAEDMARVVSVNAQLQLDLPRGLNPGWKPLIDIIGANGAFEERYKDYRERSVIQFLLGDRDSPNSVSSCLRNARENCRTVRDILPREAWQYLNELQLHVDDNLDAGLTKRGRHDFLDQIIRHCQMTMGLLGSVMTRDVAYQFVRLGRNLERADMTTRFLDMRLAVTSHGDLPELVSIDAVQWGNVLGSLSAYHMYRRKMGAQVQRRHVLWFLFNDDEFPRSVMHCLNAIEESLGALKNNYPGLLAVRAVVNDLEKKKVETLESAALRRLIDRLQHGLGDIHTTIARMYFLQESGSPSLISEEKAS